MVHYTTQDGLFNAIESALQEQGLSSFKAFIQNQIANQM
jgi:hypothetical protein